MMDWSNKLDCYVTPGWESVVEKKHSSLLGPFVTYEENEAL
jgi:hypothetical protein